MLGESEMDGISRIDYIVYIPTCQWPQDKPARLRTLYDNLQKVKTKLLPSSEHRVLSLQHNLDYLRKRMTQSEPRTASVMN